MPDNGTAQAPIPHETLIKEGTYVAIKENEARACSAEVALSNPSARTVAKPRVMQRSPWAGRSRQSPSPQPAIIQTTARAKGKGELYAQVSEIEMLTYSTAHACAAAGTATQAPDDSMSVASTRSSALGELDSEVTL